VKGLRPFKHPLYHNMLTIRAVIAAIRLAIETQKAIFDHRKMPASFLRSSVDSTLGKSGMFILPFLSHHLQKFFKEVGVVQGAGGGFGVVLDGEDGQFPVV